MKKLLLVLPVIFVMVVLNGCSDSAVTDAGSGANYSQTTPLGTLQELEAAVNDEDITDYANCLTSDYTFYFDDDDVGTIANGYTIPSYWTRQQDLDAVENMFDEDTVTFDIDFDEGSIAVDPLGWTATGTFPVSLSVGSSDEIYQSEGIFTLYKIQSGQSYIWKIYKWEDSYEPDKEIKPASVGYIKGLYN